MVLLAAPCLGLAGTLVGSVTPPNSRHELLGTLFALGVCLVLAVILLGLGVLCVNALLVPKTLLVTEDGIELRWLGKRLGNVPFLNVEDVVVKTRGMAGQTADSAFWQGFFAGGLIAGYVARSRFNPHEPIGFIIKLSDADDPDTFWPRGLFARKQIKRLDVHYYWKLPHKKLVDKIRRALPRDTQ